MPYDRYFMASPGDVFDAMIEVVNVFEKFRGANPATKEIDFSTKMSGWSWGSSWMIQIQRSGKGSVAIAAIKSAGSLVAESSEGKRISRLFDAAEELLRTAEPEPKSEIEIVTAAAIDKVIAAGFPEKHRSLISPILAALADAERWATDGDVIAEEHAIQKAVRLAASAGVFAGRPSKWCEQEIQERMADGRLRKDVEVLGRVGANLLVMSDRVIQGTTVQLLDGEVQASVEVGGQVLQSTRPTLTRMAVGSVLPGSALLVGMATPKTKTTDLRTASFILAHPAWRLLEPIDPDRAHDVSGIAAQLNLMSSQRRERAASGKAHDSSPLGMADELSKLASLRDAGILSEEEFIAAKGRLLR